MTGKSLWVALAASLLAAGSGCRAARPLAPLTPVYPVMLASAGYAGQVTITVRVDRSGRARLVNSEGSTTGALGLFTRAAEAAVSRNGWRAARRFGIARAETISYDFAFILLRDTLPVPAGERVIAGNDKLPIACPLARAPREVIVCAIPGRVAYMESH